MVLRLGAASKLHRPLLLFPPRVQGLGSLPGSRPSTPAHARAHPPPQVKKGYVGIHSSGFKDFLLKPELLRAIQDCGFEHPSEGA